MRCRSLDLIGGHLCLGQRLLLRAPLSQRGQRCFTTTRYAFKHEEAESHSTTKTNDDPGTADPYAEGYEAISEAEYEKSLWEARHPSRSSHNGKAADEVPPKTWTTLREKLMEAKDSPNDVGLRKLASMVERPRSVSPSTPPPRSKTTTPKSQKSSDQSSEKPAKKPAKERKKERKTKEPLDVKTITPAELSFVPVEQGELDVPKLSYNLDRVLFNPGVYQIQDARTKVFNFDPYLTSIMPVEEFDFDALKAYITSSKDSTLQQMSKKHGKKYCGSTSSMTAILSHFHYLLSAWRKPNLTSLSKSLDSESSNFTKLTRGPAAAYARLNDEGVYSIDADKEFDKENVLSMLGKSMEKLLTLPKEEYEKYRHTRSHLITEEERNADEAFHYTTLGDFLMRSQLDAYDSRLPGTGVFDLKTRAVVSIRMDVDEYREGRGYEIKHRFGNFESYEREYHDLIRAAFLKYSLQVRMGRMDGVFLAFHNTQRIFGFQYVSLEEMDHALHGTSDRRLGDQEFRASVKLLNDVLDRATQRFPGRSLRLHVETRETKVPLTYFFVEPVTEDDMKTSEEEAKRSIEHVQESIMNKRALEQEESSAAPLQENEEAETDLEHNDIAEEHDENAAEDSPDSEHSIDAWEEMMAKVEETVENESLGIESVKEAVHDALTQRDLLSNNTPEERQQYIDSLVETLTSDSPGLKDIQDTAENGDASTEEEPSTVGDDSPSTAPSAELDPALAAQQQALKDLIVKVTQGIDDRQRELRDFELAVSQLVDKAKPGVAHLETGEADAAAEKSEADAEPAEAGAEHASPSENEGEETDAPTTKPSSASEGAQESGAETTHAPSRSKAGVPEELMGMYITIRNNVNNHFVTRPEEPEKKFDWAIQYTINEIPEKEAQTIYPKLRRRRYQALHQNVKDKDPRRNNFRTQLREISKQGEKYREDMEQQQEGKDVFVAWDTNPLPPETRTQGIGAVPTPAPNE